LIERRITMTSAGEVIVGAINFPPGGDRIAATAGFVVLDDFSVSTVGGWAAYRVVSVTAPTRSRGRCRRRRVVAWPSLR
jgi:hypothetical protein